LAADLLDLDSAYANDDTERIGQEIGQLSGGRWIFALFSST
jgi:hypothetical protein